MIKVVMMVIKKTVTWGVTWAHEETDTPCSRKRKCQSVKSEILQSSHHTTISHNIFNRQRVTITEVTRLSLAEATSALEASVVLILASKAAMLAAEVERVLLSSFVKSSHWKRNSLRSDNRLAFTNCNTSQSSEAFTAAAFSLQFSDSCSATHFQSLSSSSSATIFSTAFVKETTYRKIIESQEQNNKKQQRAA
jgi:hypothetical protein